MRKDVFEGATTQNTRARLKLIGPGHGDDYGFGSGRVADAGGAVERYEDVGFGEIGRRTAAGQVVGQGEEELGFAGFALPMAG